jgi:DNA modification methylase
MGYRPSLSTPVGRWAAIGPYYAMFPLEFAFEVIEKHSKPGQLVVDPFAGRASSVYAAATHQRHGLGIEINPLGWVYAQAKLNPAPLVLVEQRLESICEITHSYKEQARNLPEFFHWCYSEKILPFLIAARLNLNWKENRVDQTLMAFLLIYLHGKFGEALSNQMRQTKSMGAAYSVRWWKQRNFYPPDIDYREFMLSRLRWRYEKGTPPITFSDVKLGDSTEILKTEAETFGQVTGKRCSLLFTSPPYYGITHYHKDQWLRLWLLGGLEQPLWVSEKHRGRFESKVVYYQLLDTVFASASKIMADNAIVYVRTDSREYTLTTTLEILRKHFPKWTEEIINAPVTGKTQTNIFGNKSSKPGEVDIILRR